MKTGFCDMCHKVLPADELRYDVSGMYNVLTCNLCRKGIIRSKTAMPAVKTAAKTTTRVATEPKTTYYCERCKYKYPQNNKLKIICPNCGRGDKARPY